MEREGNAYAMSSNERSVRGQSVVVANGMGEQKKDAFLRDTWSANIIDGDDFIASCHLDATFLEGMRDKTLAIIGAGDTGNCVMEYLLPLTYPNDNYASFRKGPFVPALVYWIGQNATTVQEFYFANKKRYCPPVVLSSSSGTVRHPLTCPQKAGRKPRDSSIVSPRS